MRRLLDRLLAVVEEAALDAWERRAFVSATVVATGLALTFPALAVVTMSWCARLASELAQEDRVRIFLSPAATPTEVAAVEAWLATAPEVDASEHVDSEEARARFLATFPELAPLAGELGPDELVLPASFEASIAGGPDAAARLVEQARRMGGVEEVRHDRAFSRRVAGARRALALGRSLVATAALALAGFTVAAATRIDALSRREELAVMRLVGAPTLHQRLPFVLSGAVQGGLGGLVAYVLSLVVTSAISAPLATVLPPAAHGVPGRTAAWLVGGAAVAGALGAAVSVEGVLRRHARLER